ncbi:MAG TPA: endolytic transglycosylase MltG [Candidatus Binataceae bacterium]|nr:endolytic transglycosylase MltG [Candidatus Binataceae bacterium]
MNRYVKAAAGLVALGAVAAAGWLTYACLIPVPRFMAPRIVSVDPGDSLGSVARRLAAAGVVRSARAMMLYAECTGGGRSLKPGEYAFTGGERVSEVLRHLVNGDFVTVTVAIPEGATLHQIAERLEDAGLVCQRQFEEAARSGPLPAALGLEPLGSEGYLFPATYRFSPHANVERILAAMLGRFYGALPSHTDERLFELNLSPHELVTLASIIEKEAKVAGERPTIASVFYNRLRLGMPLQSDPTAQYNPDGEIEPAATAVHTASAYNTYSFAGLPPGPIANPGMSSIMAALYPAHTDYLYFVARNDGTHIFSRTLREHQRNIEIVRKLNALNARESAHGAPTLATGAASVPASIRR